MHVCTGSIHKQKKQKMDESKHRIIQVFKILVKYFLLVNRQKPNKKNKY